MRRFISFVFTLAVVCASVADSVAQTGGTTTCIQFPTNVADSTPASIPTPTTKLIASPTSSPSPTRSQIELSICCCCVPESLPEPDEYMTECPMDGVRSVCGDDVPDDSQYTLGGLEGNPEGIARVCTAARCGPVLFVD
ncbi:hypothetical protein GGR54DRAFT_460751 [Hypoxylon sp. NC1633]|nr:hypothetical protein GGR54DRAFT_460751 [Hypoxylon sp. NC1633]